MPKCIFSELILEKKLMGTDDGVDAENKKQQDGQEGIPCWLN